MKRTIGSILLVASIIAIVIAAVQFASASKRQSAEQRDFYGPAFKRALRPVSDKLTVQLDEAKLQSAQLSRRDAQARDLQQRLQADRAKWAADQARVLEDQMNAPKDHPQRTMDWMAAVLAASVLLCIIGIVLLLTAGPRKQSPQGA